MSFKTFACSIFMLIMTSCSSQLSSDAQIDRSKVDRPVWLEDGDASYVGRISSDNNSRLFDIFEQNIFKTLHISSPGGSVEDGIALGKWVWQNDIEVHIDGICASSCANYVLPAAKKVYLSSNSVLLWHGSSYQPDVSKAVINREPFAVRWRKAENEFFTLTGISPMPTVCGFDDVSIWDKSLNWLGLSEIAGFNYPFEDLRRFGLNNMVLPTDGWKRKEEYMNKKIIEAHYCSNTSWDFE
ncbi:hypothetical protein [Idiomarina seosinensis]|uniref:Clp protease n=1 Tax=Idiomarina seosinensis TaxID=281739 RepID=A0A432ZEA7_9GAMM|nr:hypothetical protein [Idiomarina seosinensis]RUO76251.1 hypothetical protein CWI81_09090 [Idiomarina seosinensis]